MENESSTLSPLTEDRRVPSITTTLWNDGIHIVDTVRYMSGSEVVSIDNGVERVAGDSTNVYTARCGAPQLWVVSPSAFFGAPLSLSLCQSLSSWMTSPCAFFLSLCHLFGLGAGGSWQS